MHGNVLEWCQDVWHDNYNGAPTDGSAWEASESDGRLLRGGSWYYNPWYCRAALRGWDPSSFRDEFVGFRVACVAAMTS